MRGVEANKFISFATIRNSVQIGIDVDELGNVFAGLTSGCGVSNSGGCVQKWIRK